MMELTKEEQIQAIYDLKVGYTLGHADIAMLKVMARQLLASMAQEPIVTLNSMTSENGGLPYGTIQFLRMPTEEERPGLLKLYAAPQLPLPAVGDGRDQFEEWFKFHHGYEHSIVKLHRANGGANYRDPHVDLAWIAWKDSRTAMLHGAEPVSQPYTLRDGWVAVPVEPTAEMIEATFAGEMELQSVQHQMRNRERRAHYYRAMLAAAPQQEVK